MSTNCLEDMNNQVDIKIRNNLVFLSTRALGLEQKRVMCLDEFVHTIKTLETPQETPFLPSNIIKYKKQGRTITLVLYSPPTRATLQYESSINNKQSQINFSNCYIPPFVMSVLLRQVSDNGYQLYNSAVFMVKEQSSLMLNDNTKLYKYPLPNVYANGNICWGTCSFVSDTINELMPFGQLPYMFLSSNFNDDLFSTAITTVKLSVPLWFDFLTTIEAIPEENYELAEKTLRDLYN